MAKKLKELQKIKTNHGNEIYPWEEWLKTGTIWLLEPKEDYQCTTQSMKLMIRQRAKERGQKVHVYNGPEDGQIQIKNPKNSKFEKRT